jgi:serine/threonine-protein kinase PknG
VTQQSISPPWSGGSGEGVVEICTATPGCQGAILDGYCTVCGRVAVRPAPPAQAPPEVPAAAATGPSAIADSAEASSRPDTTGTTGPGTTGTTAPGTTGNGAQRTTVHLGSATALDLTTGVPLGTGLRRRGGNQLVELPVMSAVDPAGAIMADPVVPESRRFCSGCNAEVGRSKNGKPGLLAGFCSKCRLPFTFVPALVSNDLVAGQYRVLGCLAYGGLGWIYLAQDERVSNRWVVLKGLINARDEAAMEAALAERQFLARVEHPNVVRIYNVVEHLGAAYIVMEYVGGMTLKTVLKERQREAAGPLPLDLAMAYVLAILPAFSYLHELGLAYNDFKPDNVMLQADDVKLIDLGAVTRLDDPNPVVYGTEGYEAPEVPSQGPSVTADLYSVARCLAVLVLNLPTYQSEHRHSLPSPAEEPLFHGHESFYRFLLKATAHDPNRRYQSADEMAEALEALLREVTALTTGSPRPAPSRLFSGDVSAVRAAANGTGPGPDWRHLPRPRVNPQDPAGSYVLDAAGMEPGQQVRMLREALEVGLIEATAEAELGLARALIESSLHHEAAACLSRVELLNSLDWRVSWYRGLSFTAQGQPRSAKPAFDAVYSELPGEMAPKLGLALAAELSGDLATAAELYGVVSTTDPTYITACFGLARVRHATGDVAGAVEAYGRTPPTSNLHAEAQRAIARALIQGGPSGPSAADLAHASAVIEGMALGDRQRAELTVEVMEAALSMLESRAAEPPADLRVLGQPIRQVPVRLTLERAYRDLAWDAVGDEKVRLVDRANQVRPMTDA